MPRRDPGSQRLLVTVLFTDIVGSTERAAALGDRGWKELVARHHEIVRRELRRFHGRELDTAGDGFFASFERPTQAIECATAVIDDLRAIDLQIRAAIHMGEAETMGGKIGGITVHVASRALSLAGAGEILVTSTVREVTVGADVTFDDRGVHEFKGVPGEWHLYGVEWHPRELPAAAPAPAGAAAEATRRRTWWLAAAATGLIGVAVLAVTASALLPRDASEPPPVATPNSALAFGETTTSLDAVHSVGDTPTGIAADDNAVWVLSQGGRLLTGIPTTEGPPRTLGLPGAPTGIAVGEGAVWITFGFGVTGEDEGIVLRVGTGVEPEEQRITIGNGANGIAVGEGSVWVTNGVSNTLSRIDPLTRSVAGTASVGEQPVAVTAGEGSVWVAHAVERSIWRVDPRTLEPTAEISLPDAPTAVALGFGFLWVTSNVGGCVTVIDPATNGLVATIPLDLGPRGIAAGTAAMWVAGSRNALLSVDPDTRSASDPVALPGPGEGVAVAAGEVWVTVQE
jgi:YVTN family beta-propeller protein